MASAEYYLGTAGAQAMKNQQIQNQPQYLQNYGNTPPPSYSSFPQSQLVQSQYHPYPQNGRPAAAVPSYQQPQPLRPQNYASSNNHLAVPGLRPQRSHSQPPRVRFADDHTYASDSTEFEYESDSPSSDHSSRRRRHQTHHKQHHHSHPHPPDSSNRDSSPRHRDRERERERNYEKDPHRSRTRSHSQRADHKDRDTFLGAGAGGLVGDLIFPGLGTAAGLILGGYGGRKRAQRRSRSESGRSSHMHKGSGRSRMDSGWDEDSATFKMGSAVR